MTLGIDRARRSAFDFADRGNHAVGHCHISELAVYAASIDDRAVADYEIMHTFDLTSDPTAVTEPDAIAHRGGRSLRASAVQAYGVNTYGCSSYLYRHRTPSLSTSDPQFRGHQP